MTTLADAAKLMRERAEAAVDATGQGPWSFTGLDWNDVQGMTYTVKRMMQTGVCEAHCEEQAEHIASWSPAVALAVADLIDWHATHDVGGPSWRLAHAASAAYLGAVAT